MASKRQEVQGEHSAWYGQAMTHLVSVVQALSKARKLEDITHIVCQAARDIAGCDGTTFVLREGDKCYYVDENAIAPLWKGRHFPLDVCISGWTMLHGKFAAIEDIYQDKRIPQDAYKPTFVKSLVMVPIRAELPIGAIGNYWAKKHVPSEDEIQVLQALADTTSVALENVDLFNSLKEKVLALEAKEKKIQKQRDMLELFTQALASQLKEPLQIIHTFVETIVSHDVPAQMINDYVQYIQAASNRMLILLDKVFYYIQLDTLANEAKQSVSMDELVLEIKESLHSKIQQGRIQIHHQSLPDIEANKEQMRELIKNLVLNAVDHSDNPVTIKVKAESNKSQWVFSIKDNGPGIPHQYLDKVFLPFKRLNKKEIFTGLGLNICQKIIALHGGKIWCDSKLGRGSTFYFTIPFGNKPLEQEKKQVIGKEKLVNLLLVEDEPSDIEIFKITLLDRANIKCHLEVAYDAKQALQKLQQAIKRTKPFDLVILDINLPAMNGFALLEKLRQMSDFKSLPIIITSGALDEPELQKACEYGADAYLEKPPTLGQFKAAINNIDTIKLVDNEGVAYLLKT